MYQKLSTDNFVQVDDLRLVNTRLAINSQVDVNSKTDERRFMTNC